MADKPQIGPVTVIPEDTAERIEELLNALAPVIGYSPVPVDGKISAEDGERVKKAQLFFFSQMGDPFEAKQKEAEFRAELKQLALMSPPATGPQLFTILHQDRVNQVLQEVYDGIKDGEFKPKSRLSLASVGMVLGIGVGIILFGGKK